MEKQQYINYDGLLYKKDDPIITAQNRAVRYGDSLFEIHRLPLVPLTVQP